MDHSDPGVPCAAVRSRVATRDRSCARPTVAVAELVATQPEAPQRWYPRVKRLALGLRALQLRLAEEGTTFSAIVDRAHGERALTLRASSDLPHHHHRHARRVLGTRGLHGPSAGGRASAPPPTGVAEAARREGVSQTAIAKLARRLPRRRLFGISEASINAWYMGGANVVDFTDPANPVAVASYDLAPPGPGDSDHWSAYWYEGPKLGERNGIATTGGEHHAHGQVGERADDSTVQVGKQPRPCRRRPAADVHQWGARAVPPVGHACATPVGGTVPEAVGATGAGDRQVLQ